MEEEKSHDLLFQTQDPEKPVVSLSPSPKAWEAGVLRAGDQYLRSCHACDWNPSVTPDLSSLKTVVSVTGSSDWLFPLCGVPSGIHLATALTSFKYLLKCHLFKRYTLILHKTSHLLTYWHTLLIYYNYFCCFLWRWNLIWNVNDKKKIHSGLEILMSNL